MRINYQKISPGLLCLALLIAFFSLPPHKLLAQDSTACSFQVNLDITNAAVCEGTGSIAFEITGGDGSNVIEVRDKQTNLVQTDLEALSPGEYLYVVTENECQESGEFLIEAATSPEISIEAPAEITCTNPTVVLTGNSPVSGLDYTWTTPDGTIESGSKTANVTVSAAGTYTLTVTDPSTGCTNSASVLVNANEQIPDVGIRRNRRITCSRLENTMIGSSSVNGVVYAWTTEDGTIVSGADQAEVTVSAGGTYILTVTDPLTGCSNSDTALVKENKTEPNAFIETIGELNCSSATLELSGSSNSNKVSYIWSTQDGVIMTDPNQAVITVSAAGTYTLTVIHNNTGCSGVEDVVIEDKSTSPPTVAINFDGALDCSNPSLMLNGSSDNPDVTYAWSTLNGSFASATDSVNVEVSKAGTYILTVTDTISGCSASDTAMVTASSSSPNIAIVPPASITCNNPLVDVQGASTTPGVTYAWTTIDGQMVAGENSSLLTVNKGGVYTLTVTDPNTGCTASLSVAVSEASAPNVSIAPVEDLSCEQPTTTLSGASTTPGVNFSWSTADGQIVSGKNSATAVVNQAGTYILTVNEPNTGCAAVDTVVVNAATDLPSLSINDPDTISCDLPTVTLSALVDIEEVTYNWTAIAGNIDAGANTANAQVSEAGTYVLTVTNNNTGCVVSDTAVVLGDKTLPEVSIATPLTITCDNPSVDLTGSTSLEGALFSWTTPDGNIETGADQSIATVNMAGTYILTVINPMTGCADTAQVLVSGSSIATEVTLGTPEAITCDNPQVSLSVTSSSPEGLTFQWSTQDGVIVSGAETTEAIVSAAGTYTLTATNPNTGCEIVETVEVLSDAQLPNIAIQNPGVITCANPEISLVGSSTDSTATFAWTTTNGNITSDPNAANITVDAAGSYTLTVTNPFTGCTSSKSVSVTNSFLLPSITINEADTITCAQPEITLQANVEGEGWTYLWTTDGGNILSGINTISPEVNAAGIYLLTAINPQTGCSAVAEVEVVAYTELPTLSLASSGAITCATPSVQLEGTTNGTDLVYAWTSEDGLISQGADAAVATVAAGGTYTLTVTNPATGCATSESILVDSYTGVDLSVTSSGVITCDNPMVTLTGTTSVSGLVYIWTTNGGVIEEGSNSPVATVRAGGIYTLTAIDPLTGCSTSKSVTVDEFNDLPNIAIAEPQKISCINTTVQLLGSSSDENVIFEWTTTDGSISSDANQASITVSQGGVYVLTVTNTNTGCTASRSVEVEGLKQIDLTLSKSSDITCEFTSATLLANTELEGLVYSWSTSKGQIDSNPEDSTITVSLPGTYTLTVIDPVSSCNLTKTIQVLDFTQKPQASIAAPDTLTCAVTSIALLGSSDIQDAVYNWTTTDGNILSNADTATVTVDAAGTYILEVTNPNTGCSDADTVEVVQTSVAPSVSITQSDTITCEVTTVELFAFSDVSEVTYAWTTEDGVIETGANNDTVSVSAAGQYILTVTSLATGCAVSDTINVNENKTLPEVSLDAFDHVNIADTAFTLSGGLPLGGTYSGTGVSEGIFDPATAGAGTFEITYTYTGENGCEATAVQTITVEGVIAPIPVALINVGGGAFTDSEQKEWSADQFSSGNSVVTSKSFDVAGTQDDGLYLPHRFANSGAPFSYNIPVSEAGSYVVRLHFMEPFFGAPGGTGNGLGRRIFNVDIEGQNVLSNFDIVAEAGAGGVALIREFSDIDVSDGNINIDFTSVKDNAVISAIEISRLGIIIPPAPALQFASAQESLQLEENTSGNINILLNTNDNTDPVIANLTATDEATNQVPTWLKVGEALLDSVDVSTGTAISFTLDANGLALGTYTAQINATAGGYESTSIRVELTVNATNTGVITPVALINVGGGAYTDTEQRDWSADQYTSGSSIAGSKTFDVAGTEDDDLYRTFRFASSGAAFGYNIPVDGTGPYTVKLHFMESFWGAPGGTLNGLNKRVFNVDIEGQNVLSNFDIVAETGVGGVALVKEFSNITVQDGIMNIDLISVKDNAIISAIEITTGGIPPAPALQFASAQESLQLEENTTGNVSILLSTNDNTDPVNASLTATDEATNQVPTWLRVNGALLDGLNVNTGDAINFALDANGLAPGTYAAQINATAGTYDAASTRIELTVSQTGQNNGPAITSLTLYNADTDQVIAVLQGGEQIEVAGLGAVNLTVVAATNPSTVGSVQLSLSGAVSHVQNENTAPYALYGDAGLNSTNYDGQALGEGFYAITAQAFSEGFLGGEAGTPLTYSFELIAPNVEPGTPLALINAGGNAYTDTEQKEWSADQYFGGSSLTSTKTFDVQGTQDDELYLKYRFANSGAAFSYNVPVSGTGPYQVRLHFMEPFFGAPGGTGNGLNQRLFNVDVENGQGSLNNFDIVAEAGSGGVALVKEFNDINVTDGTLNINFTSIKDNAIISAIEVTSAGSATAGLEFAAPLRSLQLEQGNTGSVGNFLSTNNNTDPQTASLSAVDDATGQVPTWISVNNSALNGVAFTTGSEVSFELNAAGLNEGTYTAHVTASAAGYQSSTTQITLTVVAQGQEKPFIVAVYDGGSNIIEDGEINVPTDINLSTFQIFFPGLGLDRPTVNNNTVKLVNTSNGAEVPANVNSTGGGDAITIVPTVLLEPNTEYNYTISDGVLDLDGRAMIPFSVTFTTGSGASSGSNDLTGVSFTKVNAGAVQQAYTTLCIGPDDKLYATSANGFIYRYNIKVDGTLELDKTITTLREHRRGTQVDNDDKILIGFTFSPNSTPQNPEAWITYSGEATFRDGPAWDGNIARLTGADLQNLQDVVINLPRSVKDHLTNSVAFGPDGDLYISQAGNSAMGRADVTWGLRPERLLAAAVLKLDTDNLPANLPIDAKTEEGGNYNPYAAGAPLTIYATGIRNAYDLVWHSNGDLYLPTNGSAAGGNSPTSNPNDPLYVAPHPDAPAYTGPTNIPALTNVQPSQKDWLFRIEPGKYYGHPNPLRSEYVLNRGDVDVDNVEYNGVLPDPNYHIEGIAFDFENNKSPNGVIEYKSNVFGGKLQGMLMVVRYSQKDDIIVLEPGGVNNNIISSTDGINLGMSGFFDPLDLVEDTRNGNIYVAEYGAQKITLLKPDIAGDGSAFIAANPSELIFDAIQGQNSETKSVTVSNTGGGVLTINSASIADDEFSIVSNHTFPITLNVGQSQTFDVVFSPSNTTKGSVSASMFISSDALNTPNLIVGLHGLSVTGFEGNNEPALQDVVTTLGHNINVGWNTLVTDTDLGLKGEEVFVQQFEKAGAGNVQMFPVARYSPVEIVDFGYYVGDNKTQIAQMPDTFGEHQKLFPSVVNGTTSFDPGSQTFGVYARSDKFNIFVHTEDSRNSGVTRRVRTYVLKDRDGNTVANSFLICMEEATNGDYQDYVFILSNVKPGGNSAPLEGVVSFTLVNADTEADIQEIQNGDVINVAGLGTTNLSIRAEGAGGVGSLKMDLTGALTHTRTENIAPFALYGDTNGDYAGAAWPAGSYNITGQAYAERNGLGSLVGEELSVNFTLTTGGAKVAYADESQAADTGAEEVAIAEVTKAYPNPMQGNLLYIDLSEAITGEVSFILQDQSGRIVSEDAVQLDGQAQVVLNFSRASLQQGVYYLQIVGDHLKKRTLKIVRN